MHRVKSCRHPVERREALRHHNFTARGRVMKSKLPPEVKAKLSASLRDIKARPEVKAKLRAARKARMSDPARESGKSRRQPEGGKGQARLACERRSCRARALQADHRQGASGTRHGRHRSASQRHRRSPWSRQDHRDGYADRRQLVRCLARVQPWRHAEERQAIGWVEGVEHLALPPQPKQG